MRIYTKAIKSSMSENVNSLSNHAVYTVTMKTTQKKRTLLHIYTNVHGNISSISEKSFYLVDQPNDKI